LLGEITRTERKIRELKGQLKGVQANGGKTAPKHSAYLKRRIERVRDVAYLWRCFGDAIAFLYMDKHALKHTYFNTENVKPKNDAGFLSDKEGLAHEIRYVELALENKVPVLLVDLANTIRHGDVCVMAGPDPYLIEVKASAGLDRRGRRKRDAIEKLQKFFDTDRAEELRGFRIRRVDHATTERSYTNELNGCIEAARQSGFAVCKPERGATYFVLTDRAPRLDTVMASIGFKKPWVFSWNEWKIHRNWSPHTPFTLSVRKKDDLWDFVRGDLYILIVIDFDAFCEAARENGCEATYHSDNADYPLQVTIPSLKQSVLFSASLLSRTAFELVSPRWLITASIDVLKRGYAVSETEAVLAPNPNAV
jgi:hypothetical protein